MKLGLTIEFAPRDPAFRPRHSALEININAFHGRQIDHQAVVNRRSSCNIVSTTSHSDFKAELSAETQCIDDIGNPVAAGNQRRPPVDEAVMDAPDIIIARRGWLKQLAGIVFGKVADVAH